MAQPNTYFFNRLNANQKARLTTGLIFLAALVIIILRAPGLFTQPRFWAEEGATYYQYAYSHPWYSSLFFPSRSYIEIVSSFAITLAVNFFPVETAPFATTYTAFFIQLIPIAIILTGQSRYWNNSLRKAAAVAIILFAPYSNEIWLSTLHSQFYLAVAAFLILVEPSPESTARKWFFRMILALAGLTGFISCFLLPLFIYKAILEKSREARILAIILSVCLLGQLSAVLISTAISTDPKGIGRRLLFNTGLDTLVTTVWTRSITPLFVGFNTATAVASFINPTPDTATPGFLKAIVLIFLEAAALGWFSRRLPLRDKLFFLGTFGILIVTSNLFAIGSKPKTYLIFPGYSPRYFYAATVVLMLTLLAGISDRALSQRKISQLLLGGILLWSLVLGAYSYFTIVNYSKDWPVWTEEVAKWRVDPGYALKIWPAGWQITLTERK